MLPENAFNSQDGRYYQAYALAFPDNLGFFLVTVGVDHLNEMRFINIHRLYSVSDIVSIFVHFNLRDIGSNWIRFSFLRRKLIGEIIDCRSTISRTKCPETCCSKKFDLQFTHVSMTVNSRTLICLTCASYLLKLFPRIQKFWVFIPPRVLARFYGIHKFYSRKYFCLFIKTFSSPLLLRINLLRATILCCRFRF